MMKKGDLLVDTRGFDNEPLYWVASTNVREGVTCRKMFLKDPSGRKRTCRNVEYLVPYCMENE